MSLQNRLHGEPYLHYLNDERLNHWEKSQRKEYQIRQDSRLGRTMYIDYLHDPFFDEWKDEEKQDFSRQQLLRLRAENINWLEDDRFSHMTKNEQYALRAKIGKRQRQCIVF